VKAGHLRFLTLFESVGLLGFAELKRNITLICEGQDLILQALLCQGMLFPERSFFRVSPNLWSTSYTPQQEILANRP